MKNLALLLVVLLAGCGPEATTTMQLPQSAPVTLSQPHRFEIRLVDVFQDSLAYQDRRGVYLIQDTETGKEYLGVSGIGISETGSHKAGKSTLRDER